MLRQSRIDITGALHHIIVRGIERHKIFEDDQGRQDFLKNLGLILEQTETVCFAWSLMPNHFHLLLKTGCVLIATAMQRLLTGHAVRYNRRHRRHGHLFQNRYKSILCQQDAYLLELVRYIHLNPLRAKLVKNLEQNWIIIRFPDMVSSSACMKSDERILEDSDFTSEPWPSPRNPLKGDMR
jgi:putative transposase